jgi:short-subunit dehydrogenase
MTIDFSNQTALVTGASAGLGIAFATALAARGANLVLVARRKDRLDELAETLRASGTTVTVIAADLAKPGIGAELKKKLDKEGITIQTLINNAGFGTRGAFEHEDPARIAEEIQLNVAALVDLSRTFAPDLLAAGTGALVNVASTAAYQPLPNMAVYGATKAFVLSFTEALSWEYRESGLRVLALAPGATRTEFFDVVGSTRAAVGKFQTAEEVVAVALKELDKRRKPTSVVSGFRNAATARLVGFVPRRTVLGMSGKLMQ